MSKKVFAAIVAGIENAGAIVKSAEQRDKARTAKTTVPADRGYSRSETRALGDKFPQRGQLCHRCGLRIPDFVDLRPTDRRRIRELIRNDRPIMAMQELRAITGCSLRWAKLWLHHAGRPAALRPGPPCPFCGEPLRTSREQRCVHCGRDWRGERTGDPDRKRIPVDPTARCHP